MQASPECLEQTGPLELRARLGTPEQLAKLASKGPRASKGLAELPATRDLLVLREARGPWG
jgi:hypothetical protein